MFHRIMYVLGLVLLAVPYARAFGQPLTIYEVQYTTNVDGASDYDGQMIDCVGGIVIGKYAGWHPRVIMQAAHPAYEDGWHAIQVKDWSTVTNPMEKRFYDNVSVGDEVRIFNVEVEEYRGTTILQWYPGYEPSFDRISQNNPLPPPIVIPVSAIPAPLEGLSGEWYVENHEAEPLESMRLIVRDVTVTRRNLGKANDNYVLETPDGEKCWAADYMNGEVQPTGYHQFVRPGQHFCAVVGLFEQYTKLTNGWDYYQLVTMSAADLVLCGDGDSDGDLDIDDWPRFHDCFTGPICNNTPGGCDQPEWEPPVEQRVQHCLMMDMDYDGDVDLFDFAGLQVIFGVDYVEGK